MMKKNFVLIILVNIFSLSALLAQPANDLCAGATVVTPDGTCVPGTTVAAADNIAGFNGCQSGGSVNSHNDVWYQFTSTGTEFFATITSVAPFAGNVELILYSGACGAPVYVASQCGASPLNVYIPGITNGINYFAVISNQGSGTPGPFNFCPATATPPIVTPIPDDTICNATSINITLTSDQDPTATYLWTVNPNPFISGTANGVGNTINQTLTNSGVSLNTVTYSVIATDGSGFSSGTTTFTIFVVPSINASISSPQSTVNCDSANITLTASSGAISPTYVWSTGPTTSTIQINAVGTYSVVITSLGFCNDSASISIANFILPVADGGGDQSFPCNPDTMTLFGQPVAGATYLWTTPSGIILSGGSDGIQLNIGSTGQYIYSVLDNSNNCMVYDTVNVTPLVNPTVLFVDSISPICGLSNGALMVTGSGTIPPYTYSWDVSPITNDTLSGIPSGIYMAIVTDSVGCSDSLIITLGCSPTLIIPQFLSPNGDGDNDTWVVLNLPFYPNNKLKIFNRWGNEVYSAEPYLNDWSGSSNISFSIGQSTLPSGTYFFVLDVYGDRSLLRSSYIEIQK